MLGSERGYNVYMSFRSIVKRIIPTGFFKKIEPFGHLVEAVIANIHYGFPAKKLKIIGVTGTNGKTTTSFMIHSMLKEAGYNVAITTTVGYGIGDDVKQQVEHITTAQAGVLQKRLKDFVKKGAEWVVVETSSHALAQYRVWGLPYQIAIMTNVTHDHLDYHGTFEKYVEAKARLFKLANKNGLRYGAANFDDPSHGIFTSKIKNSNTYGVNGGDFQAKNLRLSSEKSVFTVFDVNGEEFDVTVNVPGEFNVSNALAAIAVGKKLGLSNEEIVTGIAALKSVEGRMSVVDEGQDFKVIIDFASTPDGFEKLFSSVRPLVKGKLIAVFGSAGRRDAKKRSVQGAIAGKYADIVIATEEDDRDEDGQTILEQITDGAKSEGKVKNKDLYTIPDREEAIAKAFSLASSSNDTVVLLGKGHEKTIERADGEHPWNEYEVARRELKKLRKD